MNRLLMTGIAAMLALAACSPPAPSGDDGGTPKAQSPAAPGGTVTLTAWGWNQDAEWGGTVEAFNKAQDQFKITYRGYKADEYNSIIQTGLSGSSGPDVLMLRSYGGLETLVAGGLISPIEVSAMSDFAEDVVAGATSREDDKLYGVPFAVQTAGIFYNKDIFAEQGLNPPKTWSEFIQINDKLLEAGITPIATTVSSSWMLPIVRDVLTASVYGGPALAQDLLSGAAEFTDPRYEAANQQLLELKKYFPANVDGVSNSDAQTMFASAKAAMFIGGIWELNFFRSEMPDLNVGVFSAPRADDSGDTPYTMGYVDGSWGVSAKLPDEKKEAAQAFLEWVAGEEYGMEVAESVLQLPANPKVEPGDEILAQVAKDFQENPVSYLTYVNFDYGTPSGTSLEYDALQRMMIGSTTPAGVGQELQEGISQWFTPEG